jgi:hypothetical protein
MIASAPPAHTAVIPAQAGIHFDLHAKSKMDSRFRGHDGNEQCRSPL